MRLDCRHVFFLALSFHFLLTSLALLLHSIAFFDVQSQYRKLDSTNTVDESHIGIKINRRLGHRTKASIARKARIDPLSAAMESSELGWTGTRCYPLAAADCLPDTWAGTLRQPDSDEKWAANPLVDPSIALADTFDSFTPTTLEEMVAQQKTPAMVSIGRRLSIILLTWSSDTAFASSISPVRFATGSTLSCSDLQAACQWTFPHALIANTSTALLINALRVVSAT